MFLRDKFSQGAYKTEGMPCPPEPARGGGGDPLSNRRRSKVDLTLLYEDQRTWIDLEMARVVCLVAR